METKILQDKLKVLDNEFVQKNYKGKWLCTTKALYNEKALIDRLHQYYFDRFSVTGRKKFRQWLIIEKNLK